MFSTNDNQQLVIIDFRPQADLCGVKIPVVLNSAGYSPALIENKIISLKCSEFIQNEIRFPLVNGLFRVDVSTYLIKHNEFVNISCRLDIENSALKFEIENPQIRRMHWEFTIFRGSEIDALTLAKKINLFPKINI